MKPGLAILPLEVWADISEHPFLTRQMMAQIADNNGDPGFTQKLQKLLHGCGKHTLRCYLDFSSKRPYKATQEPKIESECRALLAVSPSANDWLSYVRHGLPTSKECEFPEIEMPENIKTFKGLSIRHLDDEVLAFLEKIKPILNHVFLVIYATQSTPAPNNMRIVFTHLLPMLGNIRGIYCTNECLELLEQHFPRKLALTKEMGLFRLKPASIPTCLNWVSAPQNFDEHGPKFLWAYTDSKTIFAVVEAVRKQFLGATTSAMCVTFLQFYQSEGHNRADEISFENAATKEQLTIRNKQFKKPDGDEIHYVEILRHTEGDEAKMREWIEKRAYFEKIYGDDEANEEIFIWDPTVGHITKQVEDNSANVRDDVPSTSAKGK